MPAIRVAKLSFLLMSSLPGAALATNNQITADSANILQGETAKNGESWGSFEKLGDQLAREGKDEAAVRAYKRAVLEAGSDAASAAEKLAQLFEKLDKIDDAIAVWGQLLEIKHNHHVAVERLAHLYIQRTSYRQAITMLRRLLGEDPNNSKYLSMLATSYLNVGNIVAAEEAFEFALKAAPGERGVIITLGAIYRNRGKHQEAAQMYRDYLKSNSDDSEIRRLFIGQQIKLKRVDTDTIAMLELGARDEPSAANLYRLAIAYKIIGGADDRYLNTLERALAVEPAHDKTLTALGKHYFLKGNYSKAKDYFTRVSQGSSEGDDADEYLYRIRLLASLVAKDKAKVKSKSSITHKKSKGTTGGARKHQNDTKVKTGKNNKRR